MRAWYSTMQACRRPNGMAACSGACPFAAIAHDSRSARLRHVRGAPRLTRFRGLYSELDGSLALTLSIVSKRHYYGSATTVSQRYSLVGVSCPTAVVEAQPLGARPLEPQWGIPTRKVPPAPLSDSHTARSEVFSQPATGSEATAWADHMPVDRWLPSHTQSHTHIRRRT